MKLKAVCFLASVFGASASFLTVQPAISQQAGVNGDPQRQACHIFFVRAKRANRELRAGKVSAANRRSHWLKYRDCLGGKDKNHLLPTEFKYK